MKYLFIMLVQTSSIISAQWQDAISGNAILDSLHQEVSKFDTIEVLGPFEITLKKGNRHNITIVGESNLIPHVEFDVNKNKLVLRTSNNKRLHSKTGNPIQIAVTAKELSEIYVIGSGKISSSTSLFSKYLLLELIDSGEIQIPVKSQTVSVHITGSGHISLNGSCKTIKGKIIGSGHLHSEELKTENSFLRLTGSGQASINCSDKLKAMIDGTADVIYTGNPKRVEISTWLGGDKYIFSDRRLTVETNQ
ncbi:MAG: DUF2807 domain-containing protein [Flavobacteriaceae bacterium]|nr:DUF2807 domain-containing protein [Flavobacteriaceae bacterium]